jgi:hypothetical protein
VTTLASRTTTSAGAIAVGPTGVYWSEAENVLRGRGMLLMLPLCGGTPVTLLRSEKQERYNGIALDGTSVYAMSGDTILKLPLGGATATTLAKGVAPKAIAIDGTSVYWTDFTSPGDFQSVLKVPLNGGAAVTLGTLKDPGAAYAQWGPLTVGSLNVYWLGVDSHTELLEVPIGGGAVTTLESAKGGRGVGVNTTDVFWTDINGAILRAPLGGGAVTTIASNLQTPFAIALDASNVYWSDQETGSRGRVMKVPLSGGTPTVIASGQALADGNDTSQRLAVYGASVYWLQANAVMMAPK